jgi:thiosulfate/3-mercaptopyruvate sulfurtransferase
MKPNLTRLRRAVLTLAAALLLPAAALAAPLLTPAELAARLGEPSLRIIDVRDGKDDDGRTPYQCGHIAGSLPAPYSAWRGPKDNPGALPARDALTTLVQSLGISAASPVVIVYGGASSTDFGAAARVYWTLKAAGVKDLAILNGGIKAWQAQALPLSTDAAPGVARTDFTVTLDPRLVATRDEVAQAVAAGKTVLLDARPAAFFNGETRHAAAARPGTIVGAKNVDNAVWFAPQSGALRSTPEVQKIAQDRGIDTTQPTVSFCNTGHWAATNWFVLSEVLGQQDVKLYPESVVDWSRHDGPMANVPSRLVQFWLQLKEATGNL